MTPSDLRPLSGKPRPVLWASVVRIAATFMIFLFHFLAMHDYATYYLDVTGISLFCFISGFFSSRSDVKPAQWFWARYRVIMIPYWLVIIPVLVLNEVYGYKDTDLFRNFIILMGGSLFLYNPVYVLSWFISLILIMYGLVCLLRLNQNRFYQAALLGLTLLLTYLRFDWRIPFYIAVFFAGYFVRGRASASGRAGRAAGAENFGLNELLFIIQNYTYYFFLLHGGFLVLFIRAADFSPAASFFLALALTIPASVVLKRVSDSFGRLTSVKAGTH